MPKLNTPYLTLVTPPSTEPITLAEAKLYARIDTTLEDAVINRIITAARFAAEQYIRKSLITQVWKITYDDAAPSRIQLYRGPVNSVTSVKTKARDGSEVTMPSTSYYLNSGKELLVLDSAQIAFVTEIIYQTGYGDASAVPAEIKQGMLEHIVELYDNRPSQMEIPESATALYDMYRLVTI